MGSSLIAQVLALLQRNYLLKIRLKSRSIQEIFWPIYFILILASMKLGITPSVQPPIPSFPENPLGQERFYPTPGGVILVSPDTTNVRTLMDDAIEILQQNFSTTLTQQYSYIVFDTPEDAELYYRQNNSSPGTQGRLIAGVDFTDGALVNLSYALRMPSSQLPKTVDFYGTEGSCRAPDGLQAGCRANYYLQRGFLNLQLALDTALLRLHAGAPQLAPPVLSVQMFPRLEFSPEIGWFQTLASMYFVLAYAPFIGILLVNLVTEKEKKIKEGMSMMGMKNSAFWIAWMLTYVVVILVTTALVVLIAWATRFYTQSNMFIFALILFLYGMSIITLAFTFTAFFNKAQAAGGAGSLATLLFSALYLPISLTRSIGPDGPTSSIPVPAQWVLCLLAPVALAIAIDQSIYLDIQQGGMTWATLDYGQFPLQNCLIMLAVDVILYALLAVYLDNVIPSEYGQKQPFYFCLTPSFWRGNTSQTNTDLDITMKTGGEDEEEEGANLEPITEEMKGKEAIRMHNLKKRFTTKDKPVNAVNGFTLDIYEGQITCLLGHNGAGKTTIMNMLTGMTPPTSGTATIFGLNVSKPMDMAVIREQTGVCPQHNILYDELTCTEHLNLFAKLKAVPKANIESEIVQALADVDLKEQANVFAGKLSGGQKRKLSVAIALIGDPKLMFLDEPTAGMDPYSRRHLWSLLKQRRPGRVILLTTHFMDEADILADRKAFISRGRLQCVGSSLYLKNKFGVGYHLGLVLENDSHTADIRSLVTSHVPAASITRSHGKELDYTLPLDSVSNFADLFGSLEASVGGGVTKAQSLGISSYGVSMTSLEEVFMKIGIIEEVHAENGDELSRPLLLDSPTHHTAAASSGDSPPSPIYTSMHPISQQNTPSEAQSAPTPSEASPAVQRTPSPVHPHNAVVPMDVAASSHSVGKSLEDPNMWKQQFWALVKIRLIITFRNKQVFFFRVVMPVIFALAGLCIAKFTTSPPTSNESPSLSLSPSLYSKTSDSMDLPNVTYQLSPPYGSNASEFVTELGESVGLTRVEYEKLLNVTPHHMGVHLYDVSVSSAMDLYSNLTLQYNGSALHSLPCTLNLISNTLLGLLQPSPTPPSTPLLLTSSNPWPSTAAPTFDWANSGVFGAMILLGMAVVNIPAGMAITLVVERQFKIRSQVRIAGVRMNTYWLSVFFNDVVQFGTACLVILALIYAFQIPAYLHFGAFLSIFLLLLFYVPVTLFLAYCLSYLCNTMEGASQLLPNLFIFGSFVPYILVAVLDGMQMTDVATGLHITFTLLDPPYAIYGGLQYVNRLYLIQAAIYGPDVSIPVGEYFKWENNILICILAPLFHSIWLFFLLRYMEVRKFGGDARDVCMFGDRLETATYSHKENTDVPEEEDEDVRKERERVDAIMSGQSEQESSVVILHALRKEFGDTGTKKRGCCKKGTADEEDGKKVAVRNMSLSVEAGQVLGLLGPNGAGKTTTLNCMIAEEGLSAGTVQVAGEEVRSTLSATFHSLGYCPQHDPLWEDITLKEHLECFANIKGLPKQDIDGVVQYLMDSLKITEHAGNIAKKLSGGTKRKLSYALSMLGAPALVLLDEPSTGMDPQSKRFLWDTISEAFIEGGDRGAVLTTHYMEEADALCSRVAIMVNGELQCIGSTQHLKDRHGSGYILEVKLSWGSNDETSEQFIKAVEDLFPGATMVESFGDRITFRIDQESVGALSRVFAWFEEGRETFGIEEYSFSQATLEQVFLEFAKKQLDEHAKETPGESNQNQASNNLRNNSYRSTTNTQQYTGNETGVNNGAQSIGPHYTNMSFNSTDL